MKKHFRITLNRCPHGHEALSLDNDVTGVRLTGLKCCGRYIEVMTKDQVDAVRAVSRAKDSGPWVDWYPEMARKTVIRRLSKRLPMSTDIDELLHRDDDLYDLARPGAVDCGTADVVPAGNGDAKRPRRLQAVVEQGKQTSAPATSAPAPTGNMAGMAGEGRPEAPADEPPPGHPAAEPLPADEVI